MSHNPPRRNNLFDRVPPQNLEAERALLGAILLNPDAISAAVEILQGAVDDTFYHPPHAALFAAMRDLFAAAKPIDAVTLLAQLTQSGTLEDAGGPAYLAELTRAVPTSANLEVYAQIVRDCALARGLITTCTKIVTEAYTGETPAPALLDAAEAQMFRLGNSAAPSAGLTLPHAAMAEALAAIEHQAQHGGMEGTPTGLDALDDIMHGIKSEEFTIIAARPSVGKTSIALEITVHIAVRLQRPVAFFSLEMSEGKLCERMIINLGGVDATRLRSGFLSRGELPKAHAAAQQLSAAPIYIDDTPGLTPMALRAKARRLAAQLRNAGAARPGSAAVSAASSPSPPVIIVDYLQLMGVDGKRAERRDLDVAEASRALKSLAKELKTTVIALCQLSRAAEQGGDNARPRLSHLRESGNLEQDADAVILLSKLPAHDVDDKHTTRVLVDLAKNRNGATGECRFRYVKNLQRWRAWEDRDTPDAAPARMGSAAVSAAHVPNQPRLPYPDDEDRFDTFEEEDHTF